MRNVFSACAFGMLTVPLLAAAEPGDMMHVTTTMKMTIKGGPGEMPAHTSTVEFCTSKQHDPRDLVKNSGSQKDCAITAFNQVGTTTTFHEVCTGQMQMSGDASFTARPGGVDGSMHFTGDAGGRAMTMDMSYAATRTGDCDYTPRAAH